MVHVKKNGAVLGLFLNVHNSYHKIEIVQVPSKVTPSDIAQPIVPSRGKNKKIINFRQWMTKTKDAKKLNAVLNENRRLKEKLKSMKMKKKLENLRVQKKVPSRASPEVSEMVQVLNQRLERMMKKKEGFYAPKGSFPIQESVKNDILAIFLNNPNQTIYRLLDKLYSKACIEIHKKTPEEATKGDNMNIPIDPTELNLIRETMKKNVPHNEVWFGQTLNNGGGQYHQ